MAEDCACCSHLLCKAGRARGRAQVVAKAKVPIIKFKEAASSFDFDISFEVADGPVAGEFVAQLMRELPPMKPLILVLKIFLQQRDFNEARRPRRRMRLQPAGARPRPARQACQHVLPLARQWLCMGLHGFVCARRGKRARCARRCTPRCASQGCGARCGSPVSPGAKLLCLGTCCMLSQLELAEVQQQLREVHQLVQSGTGLRGMPHLHAWSPPGPAGTPPSAAPARLGARAGWACARALQQPQRGLQQASCTS